MKNDTSENEENTLPPGGFAGGNDAEAPSPAPKKRRTTHKSAGTGDAENASADAPKKRRTTSARSRKSEDAGSVPAEAGAPAPRKIRVPEIRVPEIRVPAAESSVISFGPEDEIPSENSDNSEKIPPAQSAAPREIRVPEPVRVPEPAVPEIRVPAEAPESESREILPETPEPAGAPAEAPENDVSAENSEPASAENSEAESGDFRRNRAPREGGNGKPWERRERGNDRGGNFPPKPQKFGGGKFNAQGKFEKFRGEKNAQPKRSWGELAKTDSAEEAALSLGAEFDYNLLENEAYPGELARLARHEAKIAATAAETDVFVAPAALAPANSGIPAPAAPETIFALEADSPAEILDFNALYESPMAELVATAKAFEIPVFRNPIRRPLVKKILRAAFAARRPIAIRGSLEMLADGNGLLLYACDSFRVKELSAFVPKILIKKFGLQRGHDIEAIAFPPMKGETAPIVVHVTSIAGADPASVKDLTPFTELTPYYPTERIILETDENAEWNNLSMRCVDLLCPIGLGQRGLIVAPPRTGKTVLLQAIANSIAKNKPNAHLIVLLVDERPEEVTDFRRKTTRGEVIASTFDESPENHVHVAEMVIERARRMVELGKDVVILLDSITRLARAYNTLMPNGGKILSGGVEAGALSKPKRFFGSARNIEGGGSLTILGTALIDTGSKMDEVIFEEFKGTGNMELDLDRDLANKRIYPAINFERSGTRKEELLYHPQEMQCVYSMRRAMKGVPSLEAMEMLISRMKKTRTNAEFLITLAGR